MTINKFRNGCNVMLTTLSAVWTKCKYFLSWKHDIIKKKREAHIKRNDTNLPGKEGRERGVFDKIRDLDKVFTTSNPFIV